MPLYAHPFDDVTPPKRNDVQPWDQVEVRQAASAAGPFTVIETLAVPLDATPDTPSSFDLQVTQATLERGWFDFVFIETTTGTRSPASTPVYSPANAGVSWAPTPTGVAALSAAYTREHVGGYQRPGDTAQAGRERDEFTADTNPTLALVEGYIAAAVDEVLGRAQKLGRTEDLTVLDAHAGLAKRTAGWHACASVEAKRRPASTDDADGLYRAFISNYSACLKELLAHVRYVPPRVD